MNRFFLIENVNVSHVNCYLRGFAWLNPKSTNWLLFNYGISYNNSCNCDLIQVLDYGNSIFNYFSIVSCTSLPANIQQHYSQNYLFVLKGPTDLLCNCLIRNNKYTNLFNYNPTLISCDIDKSSSSSISSGFIDMNPKHFQYLNTFICKASGFTKCVSTKRVNQMNELCAKRPHYYSILVD